MAIRNIARNKRRSALTGVTIAFGIVSILFSKAYLNGMRTLIEEFVVDSMFGGLQVYAEGYEGALALAPLKPDLPVSADYEAKLLAAQQIEAVSPRLQFSGMVSNGEISTMFMGMGMDVTREARVCPRGALAGGDQLQGRGLTSPDAQEIILGEGLAKNLKIQIGHTVTLLAQTQAGSLDALDFTVTGIFNARDLGMNQQLAIVSLPVAQRLLHMEGRATGYVVRLRDITALEATTAEVTQAFAAAGSPIKIRTWTQLAPLYQDVLMLQDKILRLIVALISVLVLVGVVNTMLMAVFERVREIGTLMSLGFRRSAIIRLFLIEAMGLSGAAALVGALAACLLVALARRVGLPFFVPGVGEVLNRPALNLTFLLVAVGGTLSGAMVGGLYPAYRAARLRPVEALQST